MSSEYHRHFSTTHDCDLGFTSSSEAQGLLTARNLHAASLDVDTTAKLFPHIAAILYALHLVYEVCYEISLCIFKPGYGYPSTMNTVLLLFLVSTKAFSFHNR